jgi:hypothetical protein
MQNTQEYTHENTHKNTAPASSHKNTDHHNRQNAGGPVERTALPDQAVRATGRAVEALAGNALLLSAAQPPPTIVLVQDYFIYLYISSFFIFSFQCVAENLALLCARVCGVVRHSKQKTANNRKSLTASHPHTRTQLRWEVIMTSKTIPLCVPCAILNFPPDQQQPAEPLPPPYPPDLTPRPRSLARGVNHSRGSHPFAGQHATILK